MSRTALALLFVAGLARPASADWLLTPYLGIVLGGSANNLSLDDFSDQFEQRLTLGGSLTWMGDGIIGVEFDYGISPNFFQITGGTEDLRLLDLDASMQTLSANLILGAPIGGTSGPGFRPYVTAGVGLLRSNLTSPGDLFDDLSTNEMGVNLGVGAHAFFGDRFGLRGDLRYFRGLEQGNDDGVEFGLEDFDFWRATLGLTIRFGR